jgi:hypothetical protein
MEDCIPYALAKECPIADRELSWQFVVASRQKLRDWRMVSPSARCLIPGGAESMIHREPHAETEVC